MKLLSIPFMLLLLLVSCNQVDQKQIANDAIKEYNEKETQKQEELKSIINKFYAQLSDPNNPERNELSSEYMTDDWESTPQPPGGPAREGFVKTLGAFGQMIPDLNWEVKEMLVDGNRVIVRSVATGTPNSPDGHFFGVPTNGTKKFEIQTIDVHTVENGKMVRSYHVEDWAAAIQQVALK